MHADGAIRRPEQMPCPFSSLAEDRLEETVSESVAMEESIEIICLGVLIIMWHSEDDYGNSSRSLVIPTIRNDKSEVCAMSIRIALCVDDDLIGISTCCILYIDICPDKVIICPLNSVFLWVFIV